MNQKQREYAIKRINETAHERINTIVKAFNEYTENGVKVNEIINANSYKATGNILTVALLRMLGIEATSNSGNPVDENAVQITMNWLRANANTGKKFSYRYNAADPIADAIGNVSPEYEAAQAHNAAIMQRKVTIDQRIASIHAQKQSAIDGIMLGSESEALAAINAFNARIASI